METIIRTEAEKALLDPFKIGMRVKHIPRSDWYSSETALGVVVGFTKARLRVRIDRYINRNGNVRAARIVKVHTLHPGVVHEFTNEEERAILDSYVDHCRDNLEVFKERRKKIDEDEKPHLEELQKAYKALEEFDKRVKEGKV